MKLTLEQVASIRRETGCAERTIRRWAAGRAKVQEATDMRIRKALRTLGLESLLRSKRQEPGAGKLTVVP